MMMLCFLAIVPQMFIYTHFLLPKNFYVHSLNCLLLPGTLYVGEKKRYKYVFLLAVAAKARVSEWKGGCLAVKRKIDINYIIVVFLGGWS